ncbi:MAG TPA: UDP-N-acetylmuramoyl-L-alanine--D-glutamate ligase [Gammaproteobacteria bacterium]|jgi:UDP-N-acetylmuramoylalanine--D-glutamate ligase|nr:UDP-N-acetylmuramoyl-L-alanine--D-glutamate ligase [Gammaproteobacteria bacterium]
MSSNLSIIVGLGATGLSCARFLRAEGKPFAVVDSRSAPAQLETFRQAFPIVEVELGNLDAPIFERASEIILSPGIALREPAIAKQIERGIPVIGDIELFARSVKKPVIAITGTNAKSTVTTLVAEMTKAAGKKTEVGGNLGVPALDLLLHDKDADVFVLELSSFQLETTYSLKPVVATVLNVTPDHMDRYDTLADYQAAKQRVYQNCETAVCNLDDALTDIHHQSKIYFTLQEPRMHEFGLRRSGKELYLAHGADLLLPIQELPVAGRHYQANALAALAIGYAFGLDMDAMLQVLRTFPGLPHRCQLVRNRRGIKWYNDSKGTNVGATQAAIEGLGEAISGKLILIAGGIGKNADFSPLLPAMEKYTRHVVLIGEASRELADMIHGRVPISFAATMDEAVQRCDAVAQPGDCVLLSPACASFDMFKNFEHRGQVFTEVVEKLH